MTTDIPAALEAAVREVLSDPGLTIAHLIARMEALLPGDEATLNVLRTGDGWTAQARMLSRCGHRISVGAGDPNSFTAHALTCRPVFLWPASDAENDRLLQIIRGEL